MAVHFSILGVLEPRSIACVSPSGIDGVVLIKSTPLLRLALRKATGDDSNSSINQSEVNFQSFVAPNAWLWASEEVEVTVRKFLLELHSQFDMAEYSYYGRINLKDQIDSVLFIESPIRDLMGRSRNLFWLLSLHGSNKLRVISSKSNLCGQELTGVIDLVRELISNYWPGGVQNERNFHGSHEFKIAGSPWQADGSNGVLTRTFIAEMLERLTAEGWALHSSLELSKKLGGDKTTFIFRKSARRQLHHVCLSFNERDKINFIRFSTALVEGLKEVIKANWPPGIQIEEEIFDCQQFRLHNCPWGSSAKDPGIDGSRAKHLVSHMLAYLLHRGYFVVASADVCSRYQSGTNNSHPIDVHSIWLARAEGVSEPIDSAPPPYEEIERNSYLL